MAEEELAFSFNDVKAELDALVAHATSIADLADKYAHMADKIGQAIPALADESAAIVGAVHNVDEALHALADLLDHLNL